MGYETITARQLENIRDIIDTEADQKLEELKDNRIILKTLKTFYENNRLR